MVIVMKTRDTVAIMTKEFIFLWVGYISYLRCSIDV